jgi:plastocyanin
MREYSYTPRAVTVQVGRPVRFVNRGKIAHTVADTNTKGEIVSRLIKPRELKPGQSQVVRFKKPGLVAYLCTFHPALMRGKIRVVR